MMRWLAVAIVLIMKHSCVLAANIDNRNAQEFEKEDSLKPSPKGPVGLVLTQLYANNLQENSSQKKSQVILGDYDSNYGELLETIGFDMRNITMIEVQLKNPFKHGLSTREKFIFDSGAQYSILSQSTAINELELGKAGSCQIMWGDGSLIEGDFTVASMAWNNLTLNHGFCVLAGSNINILNSAFLHKWNAFFFSADNSFRSIDEVGVICEHL